jgi:hypothetical protein
LEQVASNDLIISLPSVPSVATFTDDKEFDKLYEAILNKVAEHKPDVSTKKGRDEIASLAYKVAKTKVALDKQGLALTGEWRENTKKVNATRTKIEDRLVALQAKVRQPLTDWEKAEEARVAAHQAKLDLLLSLITTPLGLPSDELKGMLKVVDDSVVDEAWEEFQDRAALAKQDATAALTRLIQTAEKQEADAAELAELRAAQAERERIESERREAEEKEAQRRDYVDRIIAHIKQCALGMIDGKTYPYVILFRELEEKIVIDDYIGDLGEKVEAARQEAIATLSAARAADEEKAKARQAEEAAKIATEAAEQAKQEAEKRVAKAEAEAKSANEKAAREVEAERKRLADIAEAEAAKQRRRDADKAHRKQVNNNIVAELVECSGITAEQAQAIVGHLVRDLVPNVTLQY